MEIYQKGVGLSAGLMMIKWKEMDDIIKRSNFTFTGTEVNVFINFESVLNNITNQRNLIRSIVNFKQDFVLELESSILNLIANYKMYFRHLHTDAKIFLYYTTLSLKKQRMQAYKKYYRTFYFNKYNQNPQFRDVMNVIKQNVIKETKLIVDYIPNIYFVQTNDIDSFLIPYILQGEKNVILSTDIFDSLYFFKPNFLPIIIRRKYKDMKLLSSIEDCISLLTKESDLFKTSIFQSELYYRLLLTIEGSKIRNLNSMKELGYEKLLSLLNDGIRQGVVLKDFSSLESIIDLFPEKYRKELKESFPCVSIDFQYEMLSEVDISAVKEQLVDKMDMVSVESLNNKRFLNYPINLTGLF